MSLLFLITTKLNVITTILRYWEYLIRTVIIDISLSSKTAIWCYWTIFIFVCLITEYIFYQPVGYVCHPASYNLCCHISRSHLMSNLHNHIRTSEHRYIKKNKIHKRLYPRATHHLYLASIWLICIYIVQVLWCYNLMLFIPTCI